MQITTKISSKFLKEYYKENDRKLFQSTTIQRSFGTVDDYVESHVYDINENLINSNYNFINYRPNSRDRINPDGTYRIIELDPGADLINLGYREGTLNIQYNFFRKKIFSNIDNNFFIKEISSDRTEIKASSNFISNIDLESQVNSLIQEINNAPYYKDYLLNFNQNKCLIAINVALDKSEEFYNILFKLYEPLPVDINLKDTFWVVDEVIQSPIFELDLANYIQENALPVLRGPNFDINIEDTENSSLNYHSYNDLLTTSSFSSSYNQIFNILNQKGININVDYTEYSNFINFSYVTERLENFKYKLQLIELYNSQSFVLNNILTSSAYVTQNKEILKNKIDNLISKFDGYEYFLYYDSGSKPWPKQTSTKSYILHPTTSSYAISWFNEQIISTSYYDQENVNNLEYTIPEFIRNEGQNSEYILFLNMIGQHFDNIWIFINSITDINLADNKLSEGISKDLIVDTLKSLGIKLYSSNSNINLFEYLIGANENNFRYKYSEPTGSYFTTVVTASLESLPKEDINKEILKRIYHNLPLLLKSKGTERGLRTLINCYGIPDTILRINEFGGSDGENTSLETVFNRFFYSTYLTGSGKIQTPWENLSLSNAKPNAIEFRFKLGQNYNIPTQSLFEISPTFKIELIKVGNTSGSINFKYGGTSASLPAFPYINNDWWGILLNKENSNYKIYVKDNIGSNIGFSTFTTIGTANNEWTGSATASFGGSGSIYFQEIRYWTEAISESIFDRHIFNPESYGGNHFTSSYTTLAYRLPLGNNLLTSSLSSTHPNQNITPFATGSQWVKITSGSYISDEKKYYLSSFNGGFVRVNDKVRIKNSNYITGSVLSPYIRLEENTSSLSPDLHFVEVSLSPVNEINNDIYNHLGSFRVDNYIGDPSELYSSSYNDLTNLNKEYFKKYLRSYNYYDYIRLIKFFDNSLFKLIKDFIPGRSKDITGIVIESPVLERNKIKHNRPNFEQSTTREINLNSASISHDNDYLWDYLRGDKKEFYNGELSGSILDIYDYFSDNNENEYLLSKPQNTNNFIHSDFNILLNNVSGSRRSKIKQKIDKAPSELLVEAELQDSYDDLKGHQNSRYDGSKSTSLLYNNYTIGDKSYGKNASSDKTVKKIGLYTQILEIPILPKRNNISLIYLIDESGSLTELNKRNKNWCEVQNTFIGGETLVVSLFDNQKYSNQKVLDGEKLIFDSGYYYTPLLYFQTCSLDPRLYFENINDASSYLATANNFHASSYFISGSSVLGFPVSGGIGGSVFNIFNREVQDNNNVYTPGTLNTPPTYSVGETSTYKTYATFNVTMNSSVALNTSWSLQLLKNNSLLLEDQKNINIVTGVSSSAYYGGNILYYKASSNISPDNYWISDKIVTLTNNLGSTNYPVGTQFYIYPNSLLIGTSYACLNTGVYNYITATLYSILSSIPSDIQICTGDAPGTDNTTVWEYGNNYLYDIPNLNSSPGSAYANFTIDRGYTNISNALSLNLGDKLSLQFKLLGATNNNYTASISEGSLIIGSLSQTTGYLSTACPYFDSTAMSSSVDEIVLSAGLSSLYGENYMFIPNPITGSQNSLYVTLGNAGSNNNLISYGDVDYPLLLKIMDIVSIYLSDGSYFESRIVRIYIDSGGLLRIKVQSILSQLLKNDLRNNTFSKFLLLNRIDDETNAIIRFRKRPGYSSYGFIIPNNIDKNMLKNIDKIAEQVKIKLLDVGINLDGGGF